jgi:hypothetical protein
MQKVAKLCCQHAHRSDLAGVVDVIRIQQNRLKDRLSVLGVMRAFYIFVAPEAPTRTRLFWSLDFFVCGWISLKVQ